VTLSATGTSDPDGNKLDGKAQTVMIAPTLANNVQIGIIQVKVARQLI
jgi:hypothetical protein